MFRYINKYEDGTGSRRPLFGDVGVSPYLIY